MVDSKVIIVTLANEAQPGLCSLMRSAALHGYEMHVLGGSLNASTAPERLMEIRPWIFHQFIAAQRRSGELRDHDIVVVADGFDVVAQASPQSVIDGFAALSRSGSVLFSGETYCYPALSYCRQYPRLTHEERMHCNGPKIRKYHLPAIGLPSSVCWDAKKDPPSAIRLPFVNGGLYGGYAAQMQRVLAEYRLVLLSGAWPRAELRAGGWKMSDQPIFHQLFVDRSARRLSIGVDRQAVIFMNMCCPARVLDRFLKLGRDSALTLGHTRNASDRPPAFVHWSGGSAKKYGGYRPFLPAQPLRCEGMVTCPLAVARTCMQNISMACRNARQLVVQPSSFVE